MAGLIPAIHVLIFPAIRAWMPGLDDAGGPESFQSQIPALSNFTIIEITPISTPNVSSRALRRNNSPAHETIFRLACRRPETFADYQFAQQAPPKRRHRELVMQNVIAINAAGRQGIIPAQPPSDEMLLESIADGGRSAMHLLYS